jgi:hypothetical protein
MPPVSFRAVEANNAPNIAPDFGSDSRRIKGRISGYATLDATQKPDQKTSEMGHYLFPRPLGTISEDSDGVYRLSTE